MSETTAAGSKVTYRAMVIGIASIFVCLALLVGTTLAWFTSTVTVSNNVIRAGTYEAKMYFAGDVYPTAGTGWQEITETTNPFQVAQWYPNSVVYRYFKVTNGSALHQADAKLYIKLDSPETDPDLASYLHVYSAPVNGAYTLANRDRKGDMRGLYNNAIQEGQQALGFEAGGVTVPKATVTDGAKTDGEAVFVVAITLADNAPVGVNTQTVNFTVTVTTELQAD